MQGTTLEVWVVGFVMTAIVGVLGFLVRNAFDAVGKGLEGLSKKLDDMSATIARGDGDRRVLESRVVTLEREMSELRREVREASEGKAR